MSALGPLSTNGRMQHASRAHAHVHTCPVQVALHDYYIIMPEAVAALEERERVRRTEAASRGR